MIRKVSMSLGMILFVLAAPVAAGKVNPLVSASPEPVQVDRNVEGFGFPVWNPTSAPSCVWDPDDHYDYLKQGYLDAGAKAVISGCLIANANPLGGFSWAIHPRFRIVVTAGASLDVSICYQPQNWCRSGETLCTSGPFYDPSSPAIQAIPNSTGFGVPTTFAITIANPGTRRVSPIGVSLRGGNDQDQCPALPENSVVSPDHTFWWQ